MSSDAIGTFQMKQWGEKPVGNESALPKMTRTSATAQFSGGIEGIAESEYSMMYRQDNSAVFAGLMRITGRVEEREGSFALQCAGIFDPASHTATCEWSVIPGSGTGDLRGLTGKGGFTAPGIQAEYELQYDFGEA